MAEKKALLLDAARVLERQIDEAAGRLESALVGKRPLLVRHHGDADGVCGAIAVYRAVKNAWGESEGRAWFLQSNTAAYAEEDARRDAEKIAELVGEGEKPLAIFIDFAGNEESLEQLGLVRRAGAEILLIDHHPTRAPLGSLVDTLVSPWSAGAGSELSAGYLTCEVVRRASKAEVEELAWISLSADKSPLARKSKMAEKAASVLDYIASQAKRTNPVEAGEAVLASRRKLEDVFAEASQKLEEAVARARKTLKLKRLANGFVVALVKLDRALAKGEYPTRGRICGEIHDSLATSERGPLVTIAYASDVFNFRANEEAKGRGFKANELIQKLKGELTNAVEAGGGHYAAAAVKLRPGFMRIALEFFLNEIGALQR
ncbi:MAG: DHH family phosphoesterase [Candidatus Micrarchaeia archaeon]